MTSFRGSTAALLATLALAGCTGPRALLPSPGVTGALSEVAPPKPPLPTEAERAAWRLTALVLADRPDSAALVLEQLRLEEDRRSLNREGATGLLDDADDLVHSADGESAYTAHAEHMLAAGDPDPELRRRLEDHLDSRPLTVAARRLRADRVRKIGGVFNRLIQPLAALASGGILSPIETGRAALASLMVMRSFPEATPDERQALRAYQEFLDHRPDAPEAPEVAGRLAYYQERWLRQLHGEALEVAEQSLAAGRPDVALRHLERADRLVPDSREARALREQAQAAAALREERVGRALSAVPGGASQSPDQAAEFQELAEAVLVAPFGEIAFRADEWALRYGPGELDDELRFIRSLGALSRGDETAFFEEMTAVASLDPEQSNMSRHAAEFAFDPELNPYRALEAARSAARSDVVRWLMLGSQKDGPRDRDLPTPIEWLLDLPPTVNALLTFPMRLLQISGTQKVANGPVLHAGERYLARFPSGEHAAEVHRELEDIYAARGQWSQALEHHQARSDPEFDTIAEYREKIAERTLDAAQLHERPDVRISIYRSVVESYPETAAARRARGELADWLLDYTPQHIRLSRKFLLEEPALWRKGALSIRPYLLDGDEDNGEIADEGITLIGRNAIEVPMVDGTKLYESVPEENFSRFVALLEETSYERLVTDEREIAVSDPQRDLFFERARLGLTEVADMRPSARSDATFLSTSEKFGLVHARESILPVEVVLRGGLEDLGLSAFPRIRLPRETPESFLYE